MAGFELVNRYIKLRPNIVEEVEAFCRAFFLDKHVIALHLRSGEKDREGKQVSPAVLIDFANNLRRDDTVFFVLTDSNEYLEYAKMGLEGPVVATSSLRVDNAIEGVHEKYAGDIRVAQEALIDALIASRADIFLFTTSNLAFAVLAFNANLQGISLRFDAQANVNYYGYLENSDAKVLPKSRESILADLGRHGFRKSVEN